MKTAPKQSQHDRPEGSIPPDILQQVDAARFSTEADEVVEQPGPIPADVLAQVDAARFSTDATEATEPAPDLRAVRP